MSPKFNHNNGMQELIKIGNIIGKFVLTNEIITPHNIMECLKEQSDAPELSHLGNLIRLQLDSKADFDILRWIVFHFDLDTSALKWPEKSTRNWIALHRKDQYLVNMIHAESVGQGIEFIKDVYAPSIVSSKLKDLNIEKQERLREKWWIYSIDRTTKNERETQHDECSRFLDSHSDDIMYFSSGEDGKIHVLKCSPRINRNFTAYSLGEILNEPDNVVRSRYLKFVKYYSKETWSSTTSVKIDPSCNFYARVPVFFYREPKRYMTEIFVAFNDKKNKLTNIVRVLKQIIPSLRICVNFINSHIAYVIAEEIDIQKKVQFSLQEQAHTIINNFPKDQLTAAMNAKKASDRKNYTKDAMAATNIFEQAVLVALGRGVSDEFPRSLLKILKWLERQQQSLKAKGILDIDPKCKDIHLDDISAGAAFTLFWNLWDNAEKNARRKKIMIFNIIVRSVDDDQNIEVNFVNKGELSDECQKYLLGIIPELPHHKKFISGLEIIKNKLGILEWKVKEITVSENTTSIKIKIPMNNYK